MPTKKRKTYTPEFKARAVKLVQSGTSVAAAAKKLKVTPKSVATWVKATKPQQTTTKSKAQSAWKLDTKKKAKGRATAAINLEVSNVDHTAKITRLEKALAKSQADLADLQITAGLLRNDVDTLRLAIRVLSN